MTEFRKVADIVIDFDVKKNKTLIPLHLFNLFLTYILKWVTRYA